MKQILKLLGLLLLLFIVGGLGFWYYMRDGDQGHATEAAADAIVSAANTAADWARDTSMHRISIVNLIGTNRGSGIPGPIVVVAQLDVKGGLHKSALCGALPLAHDAINVVLADPVSTLLSRDAPVAPDSLAAYDDAVRDQVNHEIAAGTVNHAKLIVKSARDVSESGCYDRKHKPTKSAEN